MNAGLMLSQNFDDALVDVVMHHWRNGKDTWQISELLKVPQETVEQKLHVGLERKRSQVTP